jgi:hypothetical protein
MNQINASDSEREGTSYWYTSMWRDKKRRTKEEFLNGPRKDKPTRDDEAA